MTATSPVQRLLGRLPEPGLEATLAAVRLGMVPADVLVDLMAGWPFLVLDDDGRGSGVQPLLLRADTGDVLVAAFTSPDRVGEHADPSRRLRWLSGGLIARGARPGVGITVNPGSEPAIAIGPDVVDRLRRLQPTVAWQTPGSRRLSPLEHAIVAANASLDTGGVALAAKDAEVVLISATDPAASGLTPAVSMGPAGRRLLAWTDPGLVRSSALGWAVIVVLGDVPEQFDGVESILLNPGTGLERELAVTTLLPRRPR